MTADGFSGEVPLSIEQVFPKLSKLKVLNSFMTPLIFHNLSISKSLSVLPSKYFHNLNLRERVSTFSPLSIMLTSRQIFFFKLSEFLSISLLRAFYHEWVLDCVMFSYIFDIVQFSSTWGFSSCLLLLISSLIPMSLKNILCKNSIILNMLRFTLQPKMCPILEKVTHELEKNIYSPIVRWSIVLVSIRLS